MEPQIKAPATPPNPASRASRIRRLSQKVSKISSTQRKTLTTPSISTSHIVVTSPSEELRRTNTNTKPVASSLLPTPTPVAKIEDLTGHTLPKLQATTHTHSSASLAAPSRSTSSKASSSPTRYARLKRLNASKKKISNVTFQLALKQHLTPTKSSHSNMVAALNDAVPNEHLCTFENAPASVLDRYRNLKKGGDEASSSKSGIFVAEGPETIKMLLRSNTLIESLLLKESVHNRLQDDIELRRKRLPNNVFIVVLVDGQSTFTKAVGYTARGALAVGKVPPARDVAWLCSNVLVQKPPNSQWRLLAIDGSNNPANLGNILRSAKALEVDGVLLSADCCDPWYRRSVRVSMGHIFDMPIVRCTSLSDDLLALQQDYGISCYSAVVTVKDSTPVKEIIKNTRIGKFCCVLGAEHAGVSEQVRSVTQKIRIPMRTGVDSLSITAAASILLAQLRQDLKTTKGTKVQEKVVVLQQQEAGLLIGLCAAGCLIGLFLGKRFQ